jgi:hypothetical protein
VVSAPIEGSDGIVGFYLLARCVCIPAR